MSAKRFSLKNFLLSALLTGGCIATGAATAHTPADRAAVSNVNRLSALANVVVQTRVTRVTYRLSAPGNGSRGVPYTFVTFAVTNTLQGAASGNAVTLRFIGGSDGRGGFVDVEGVPKFEVGDQDILFVANNGSSGCALVMCEFGRFRVLANSVYGTHGEPVLSATAGRLTFGSGYGPAAFQVFRYPAPSFDDMMKNPAFAAALRSSGMSAATARARYQAQAPKAIEVREHDVAGINGVPRAGLAQVAGMPVGQFLSSVTAAAAARAGRASATVQSANASAPLIAPAAGASAPPAAPRGSAASASPGPIIQKN